MDSTNQKRLTANAHAHRDVFEARLPWQEMVKLNKGSIFVITETQFAIQSHVNVTKQTARNMYAVLSTCRCNNNAIFSDRAIFKFPEVNINLAAARSLGSSCQTGKMAALLNSLFFVFKIGFVPKYRVIHYDYIVKWCSGNIMYTVCTLDIAL